VGQSDPADFAALRAFLPRVPLAGAPEVLSGVAQRLVACRVDGVADDLPLGFGRREFGGKGDGFMGANTKSNPEFLRACSLQSAPLSARRASKRASSCALRGSERALPTPSAAATAGDISGRQLARSPRPI
jgi:hypothetical protein